MIENTLTCPSCGELFEKGSIQIYGRTNSVHWVKEPKQSRFGIKWKTKELLFRSLFSTYRIALRCEKCHLILFDTRDPKILTHLGAEEPVYWQQ